MERFDSVFRRKNKTYVIITTLYAIAFVALSTFAGGISMTISYKSILFLALVLFMFLRYLLFIFEVTYVDCQRCEVRLELQHKVFSIIDITTLVKQPYRGMVKGQMRITCSNGKQYPIYVDDEDRFIELLLSVNGDIAIS